MPHLPIIQRQSNPDLEANLRREGLSPLQSKLMAARGIGQLDQLDTTLSRLLSPLLLKGMAEVVTHLKAAIAEQKSILIVGDYDADGATASAIGFMGLKLLGAKVDFLVPNRFTQGYGLTTSIVEMAAERKPDLILTVDNGISSVEGVNRAHKLGIQVLVTDHHLAGEHLPDCPIVNPNQPGCTFPSKHLAGCGVMLYVVMALRDEMLSSGQLKQKPDLSVLLPLVALGTVADVVILDQNNRILVQAGLSRMRAGKATAGLLALFDVAGRKIAEATTSDLGFSVGPRLNAAGRLDDMTTGILCLMETNPERAHELALQLDQMNRERRQIEGEMQEIALFQMPETLPDDQFSVCYLDTEGHQGVMGIVASRLKDRFHRPTLVFASGNEGELKGSGRSISGLHLRDVLDLVDKRVPDVIIKFGGHAMAAGLTIKASGWDSFAAAFEQACKERLTPEDLSPAHVCDGTLTKADLELSVLEWLEAQLWGQGFPAPLFSGTFRLTKQSRMGREKQHIRFSTTLEGKPVAGVFFNAAADLPDEFEAVYAVSLNRYQGSVSVQLMIREIADTCCI